MDPLPPTPGFGVFDQLQGIFAASRLVHLPVQGLEAAHLGQDPLQQHSVRLNVVDHQHPDA